MEPDPLTPHEDDPEIYKDTHYSKHTHRVERLAANFPKQTLHAKEGHKGQESDAIEIPPVHDAFVDSHLFDKHAAEATKRLIGHTETEYIDHHDDYYRGEQGDIIVDHHDVRHVDRGDDWEVDHLHHVHHPHSPHDDYKPRERPHTKTHHDDRFYEYNPGLAYAQDEHS